MKPLQVHLAFPDLRVVAHRVLEFRVPANCTTAPDHTFYAWLLMFDA
jgi:hypothetical protein